VGHAANGLTRNACTAASRQRKICQDVCSPTALDHRRLLCNGITGRTSISLGIRPVGGAPRSGGAAPICAARQRRLKVSQESEPQRLRSAGADRCLYPFAPASSPDSGYSFCF
jgi:hypothetical protein